MNFLSFNFQRLNHVRVKKLPADFPDRHTSRSVRNSAVDRIMRRRSLRQCRIAMNSTAPTTPPSTPTDLVCPSCNLAVPSSTSNEGAIPKEYSDHVEECLATRTLTNSHLENFETDDDDDVDVDSVFSLETYTWAGQERVRATSLVEGGLRGPGFVSITRGDESEELNILDVDDDEDLDSSHSEQYKETDLIFPKSEESDTDVEENSPLILEENSNDEDIKDDLAIQIDHSNSHSNVEDLIGESSVSKDSPTDSSEIIIKELREENSRLRETSMCNICMDSYNTPLVSKKCWHVSCEECWMRALGAKKLCPQCKIIIQPKDLRRIYL